MVILFPPYTRTECIPTPVTPGTNSRIQPSWGRGTALMGSEDFGRRIVARSEAQEGYGRHWKCSQVEFKRQLLKGRQASFGAGTVTARLDQSQSGSCGMT